MGIVAKMRKEASDDIGKACRNADLIGVPYIIYCEAQSAAANHNKKDYRWYLQHKRSLISLLITYSHLSEEQATSDAIRIIKAVKALI